MSYRQFKKIILSGSKIINSIPEIISRNKDIIRAINMLQNNISDSITPLIQNSQNDSNVLSNISLLDQASLLPGRTFNVINHGLGRKLRGWKVVRLRSPAVVSDVQDSNNQPNLTLLLVSSANCVVDLEVF
jgi:hypothetical protein